MISSINMVVVVVVVVEDLNIVVVEVAEDFCNK
jgi:hypothetical protein